VWEIQTVFNLKKKAAMAGSGKKAGWVLRRREKERERNCTAKKKMGIGKKRGVPGKEE